MLRCVPEQTVPPEGGGCVIKPDSEISNSHESFSLDSTNTGPRFNQSSFAYCMLHRNSRRILKQIQIHLLVPLSLLPPSAWYLLELLTAALCVGGTLLAVTPEVQHQFEQVSVSISATKSRVSAKCHHHSIELSFRILGNNMMVRLQVSDVKKCVAAAAFYKLLFFFKSLSGLEK